LYDGPFRRHPRPLTTAEIARIRDLWRIGRTRQQIADMTGFAVSTVRTHTRRIAIDREVGG
jgi:DNA-binding NarL/FixJ family response regulator